MVFNSSVKECHLTLFLPKKKEKSKAQTPNKLNKQKTRKKQENPQARQKWFWGLHSTRQITPESEAKTERRPVQTNSGFLGNGFRKARGACQVGCAENKNPMTDWGKGTCTMANTRKMENFF